MSFLNNIFKKKVKKYTPIKSIINDDTVPGENINAILLTNEFVHRNNIKQSNQKYLLKINDNTANRYIVYEIPQIKNKLTQQYENLNEGLVVNGKCPICENSLENRDVITIEFHKEKVNKGKLEISDAIPLVSLHTECSYKYDLEDITLVNKG